MIDLLAMTHWSWLVLGLALLVLELIVTFTYFLWLGASALVTGLVLFLYPEMSWQIQFLLFSVLAVASILLSWKYFSSKRGKSEPSNLNRRGQQYVGRVFTLTEAINNGYGKISVDDSHWRVTGPALAEGARVKVIGADGSVLAVEPA